MWCFMKEMVGDLGIDYVIFRLFNVFFFNDNFKFIGFRVKVIGRLNVSGEI